MAPGHKTYLAQPGTLFLERTVADTGHIDINGHWLRYQHVKDTVFNSDGSVFFFANDTLVEYMGAIKGFIHPYYTSYSFSSSGGHEHSGAFRCYDDNGIGLYQGIGIPPGGAGACEYILGLGDDLYLSSQIDVYPNPGSGQFTFTSNLTGNTVVKIYSMYGQQIWSGNIQSVLTLDARSWQNGTYLVRFTNGQAQWSQKLVKID